MIDPARVIMGNSFCTRKTGALAVRLNTVSKGAGVRLSIEPCSVKPAFDTMMSTTPFWALTAASRALRERSRPQFAFEQSRICSSLASDWTEAVIA